MQSLTATESEEFIMTTNYQIMNNEYLNTGGNCMVHITDVYNCRLKKMQYVFINEEYLVVSDYDYIRNELPHATTPDDFMLHVIAIEDVTHEPSFDTHPMFELPEEITDLLFDCYLLFIRAYCKYTSKNYVCRLDALPNVLYDQVTREYSHWLAENELDPVTDGYQIIIHPQYFADTEDDTPNAKAAKELLQHLPCLLPPDVPIDHVLYDKFVNEKIQIIFGEKLFTFENGADIYNALDELAKFVIDQQ